MKTIVENGMTISAIGTAAYIVFSTLGEVANQYFSYLSNMLT